MAVLQTLIGIVAVLSAIWVIYDILFNNKRLSTAIKIVWIVCALLFGIITAVIYYFMGRSK